MFGQEGRNHQVAVQIVFAYHMLVWSICVVHDMVKEAVDAEILKAHLECTWA